MTKQEKQEEIKTAIKYLRKYIKRGSTVYTMIVHVSQSGMTFDVRMYVAAIVDRKPAIVDITESACVAMGSAQSRTGRHYSIRVRGHRVNAGLQCVHRLGRTLWPKSDRIVQRYPGRPMMRDSAGDYLLTHKQM